jgi:hypothetical protein
LKLIAKFLEINNLENRKRKRKDKKIREKAEGTDSAWALKPAQPSKTPRPEPLRRRRARTLTGGAHLSGHLLPLDRVRLEHGIARRRPISSSPET